MKYTASHIKSKYNLVKRSELLNYKLEQRDKSEKNNANQGLCFPPKIVFFYNQNSLFTIAYLLMYIHCISRYNCTDIFTNTFKNEIPTF